ncbi:MAG: hypothetical protein KGL51_00430 [Betaproteobacteria bacterium]|nr:hypothetical protein [Betaproteobacteria bacterium]MDE2123583.1 hypothetical protein [Betaproteobacteria bacterium]MDE2186135.1 hypothetical protein [Betaproteobacteria bacterium]MDE2323132.1 hypothetical protein [Betaproteobacteria bacterium]
MTDIKTQAARQFSEAVNSPHEPEHMDVTEYGSRADWLAAHCGEWNAPSPPRWWAGALATETAERQGWDIFRGEAMRLRAAENNMRTFEAAAAELPLLQWPDVSPWPKGQPLPGNWREGLFMRKADLRAWAREHAPHLLGSALLAEAESAPAGKVATIAGPGTPAEQWQDIAREIAQTRWDAHKAANLQGKLDDYAEHVELELRKRGIAGPRGEWLSAATVKREALQGEKWWKTRKL